ncbi:MAG: hypothetical protein GKS06_01650 [Acidobacteria bacterium]|nr:hypothetical protein [Acidobacteriota bacterium]
MTMIETYSSRRPTAVSSTRCALLAIVAAGAAAGMSLPALGQQMPAGDGPDPLASLSETAPTVINMILIRVNGDPILLSDLRSRVDERVDLARVSLPEAEIEAQLPALRWAVLEGMVEEKMMEQRADRLGIIIGPNDLDRYIANVQEQNGFASEADLLAEMAKFGMTMDDLREQGRRSMQQQRLVFEEVNRSIIVTDTDIQEYFEENLEDFRNPEEVRLEQLVFIGDTSGLADQAAAAATQLQGGADLETVGGEYVDATPVPDSNTFIGIPDLTEALAEAVPGLETGVWSEPIPQGFGLSIVRVIERTQKTVAELDDVRENIRQRLLGVRSQERMQEYMGELRAGTRLEILDTRLERLRNAWGTVETKVDVGQ